MSSPQTRQRPGRTGRGCRNTFEFGKPTTVHLPSNWRDRLPDPDLYYRGHVIGLSQLDATGWVHGACPLHDDCNESLSIHVADKRGGWRCTGGCGAGDMVAFHERLREMSFTAAVRDLLGLGS